MAKAADKKANNKGKAQSSQDEKSINDSNTETSSLAQAEGEHAPQAAGAPQGGTTPPDDNGTGNETGKEPQDQEGDQAAPADAPGNDAPHDAAPQDGAGSETQEPLKSLDELEQLHRVPGWQQAALMRLMGWQPGKMVTVGDYEEALDKLHNRNQGGGRF